MTPLRIKAWRARNKEKVRSIKRASRAKKREHYKAKSKEYYERQATSSAEE